MNTTLHINGIIAPEGNFLPEEKNFTSAKMVQEFLSNVEGNEVFVDLNTPGGSVDEGFVIYDLFRNSGKKVIINAYQANSIGSVILLAGDERNVSENFQGLVHNAWLDPQYLLGEQLNAQMLGQLKEEAERNDARILNLYTSILGKQKEQELIALMGVEAILDADKALELGFATGKITSKEKSKANRSMAFSNLHIQFKNEQMSKNEELISKFEAAINKFTNLFTPKAQNMTVELEDGTKVYVESDGADLKGKRAFLIENDQPSEKPAPNGDHKLKDGRVITVADGVVTEVIEAAPAKPEETVEAVKKQMEEMKAAYESKISAMSAEKETATAQAETMKTEVSNLQKEFTDFKNQIAADPEGEENKDYSKLFENKKHEELSIADQIQKTILTKK